MYWLLPLCKQAGCSDLASAIGQRPELAPQVLGTPVEIALAVMEYVPCSHCTKASVSQVAKDKDIVFR